MSPSPSLLARWGLATGLTALAAGVMTSRIVWRETDRLCVRIHEKTGRLAALSERAAGQVSEVDAREALEALSSFRPPFVQNVAGGLMPGVPLVVRELDPQPLDHGWALRRVDVTMDAAPMEKIGMLVLALESERPPWRLRSFHVEALPDVPGSARTTLRLEALSRPD